MQIQGSVIEQAKKNNFLYAHCKSTHEIKGREKYAKGVLEEHKRASTTSRINSISLFPAQ